MLLGKGLRLLGIALALSLFALPAQAGLNAGVAKQNTGVGLSRLLEAMAEEMAPSLAAAAGGGPQIKQMKLSIWPEYDDPRVLAIYDGQFADTTGFPKQVQFRIPKGADINQVCGLSDKGEHLCQLYEVKQGADYDLLVYTIPVPHFFLEYYFNPVGSDPVRNISYTFSAEQATDKLDVEVQQPLRSTDFTTSPSAMSSASDNDGFNYAQLTYQNVAPDQNIDLKISYSKQDTRPSVAKKQQNSSGGPVSDSSNLNVGYLLVGAVVLGLGGYFFISRHPNRLVTQPAGYGHRSAGHANYSRGTGNAKQFAFGKGKGASKTRGAAAFCTGCGTPLDPGDRFCPSCGKRSKA